MLARLGATAYLASQVVGEARVPFWADSRLRRAGDRRAARMVDHAYRTVPHYRQQLDELRLAPEQIRTVDDLARLPILERAEVQRDPLRFTSSYRPLDAYRVSRTSGSSGQPLAVHWEDRAILRTAARAERYRPVIASRLRRPHTYREAFIVTPKSSARAGTSFMSAALAIPKWARVDRLHLSSLADLDEMAADVNAFRPDVVNASGSTLTGLYGHLQAEGRDFHRPRVVLTSGELLAPHVRAFLEELGVLVVDLYQAVEAHRIAFQCESGAMHVNADVYPVRVVDRDGRDVPPGESGDIVVSNLENPATVLLNYRIGDVGALSPDPCGCGRTLPVMAALEGRSDDWLDLPGGRRMHPQGLAQLFRIDGVRDFQVRQVARDRVEAVVVVHGDRAGVVAEIEAHVGERLGRDVHLEIRLVDTVPMGPAGKRRAVVGLSREAGDEAKAPTGIEPV